MTNLVERGRLFTTEPMATRALAAELRFAPAAAQRIAEGVVGHAVGALKEVRAERDDDEKADVLLIFESAKLGIEAKFDHAITDEQLNRLVQMVDHLILLVVDKVDADGYSKEGKITVETWATLLGKLPGSRITVDDVAAMDDKKRRARRALAAANLTGMLPSDVWQVPEVSPRSEGGLPSFTFKAPLTSDRQVTVRVAADRKQGSHLFVINAGVDVLPGDFIETGHEPDWVQLTRIFCAELEDGAKEVGLRVSEVEGKARSERTRAKLKMATDWNLPRHYAVGYTDSFVGLKLDLVEAEEVAETMALLLPCVEEARQVCIRKHLGAMQEAEATQS